MRSIRTFSVVPSLPARLAPLRDIAHNLWWAWTQDARDMFIRMDRDLWDRCGHSPVAMLGGISQSRLEDLAVDSGFLAHLERVKKELDEYLYGTNWFKENYAGIPHVDTAYFCAEFGLHESLPIYSGGLGLLAGDHLKAASGLGLPLTAVGLFYYNGYFRQYLNSEGFQQEYLQALDFPNMPCTLERKKDGTPLLVDVDFPGRKVYAQVWRINVGRCKLYLLDTRVEKNMSHDRAISDQLYGGDHEHRLQQELLLGIGGVRALRALGIEPQVCHMNEGHSAFLAIERMRVLIEEKRLHFRQALESVTPGNIFTTHTPVPAGNEVFGTDLMDRYFGEWYARLGVDRKTFLALGRQNPHNEQENFSMTILALRTAGHANGVSALHGEVSRKMWSGVWPEVPDHEVPIDSITNGVHIRSYVSGPLNELFVRYCGHEWSMEAMHQCNDWAGPERIPDSEVWRVHNRRRERLVIWARDRYKNQLIRSGATSKEVAAAEEILDPEALTIGFARRFATYKRGILLFSDPDRLAKILSSREHPVQVIFAGKAHPKDAEGKKFIQKIYQFARDPRFKNRVIFIEDYDILVARYLVQGVDVWLNNPRRPLEASGTSGMKAAVNGALNCSILDGWWCEGYDEKNPNGFAIGRGEEYTDLDYQDEVESRALYDLLEKQIVPMFFDRGSKSAETQYGEGGLPREWVQRMKSAIKTAVVRFSTIRMVREYYEKFYGPAGTQWLEVNADNFAGARSLFDWKQQMYQRWAQIRVLSSESGCAGESPDCNELKVGGKLKITARVHIDSVPVEHLEVQAYHGALNGQDVISKGVVTKLLPLSTTPEDGILTYSGEIACGATGRYGYEIRVLPRHPLLHQQFIPGLITWG